MAMSNVDVARKAMELVSAGKFAEIEACIHDDIVVECPYQAFHSGPMARGRERFLRGLATVPMVFSTFKLNIHEMYDCPEQDTVVFEQTSMGRFAANGELYQNRYIMVFGFRDGKIVLWREYFNPDIMNRAMAFMLEL